MGFFGGGASVDLASPPAIGNTTPNTGAFTTLSANNGTITTSSPAFTLAQTWNASAQSFTALRLNVTDTASASGSYLLDLQVGGTTRFRIGKGSVHYLGGNFVLAGTALECYHNEATALSRTTSSRVIFFGQESGVGMAMSSGYGISWSSNAAASGDCFLNRDLFLLRDAAGTLAIRNSTNAQTFRLYNTFTDASNYERGFLRWASNVLEIGAEAAGTGTKRTTRITAQDKTGGYVPIIELGFYPNNLLATRLSFTNNGGAAVQWGIDGSFIGNFSTDGFMVGSAQIGWNSGVPQNAADLVLTRDAADILAQRRTTNSQTFRLYRTFTNSTNYERLSFIATRTTRFAIAAENAGTGAARSLEISFYTSASDPASTDITDGCFSVWKNSGTGTIKLWANDGGTMKSVALA